MNVSQKLGLEEALDIAMDAELKAQAFYAQAAVEVQDPRGKDLLSRLAAFEQHHYQMLAELARSLQDSGQFIEYEAQTVAQFVPFASKGEASGTLLDELKDEAGILGKAIENEKIAGERYQALAAQTDDPAGQDMFKKLVLEEQMHQRILEDEFFSLSNRGAWGWSGMYGE
jgi:rubrerythrin